MRSKLFFCLAACVASVGYSVPPPVSTLSVDGVAINCEVGPNGSEKVSNVVSPEVFLGSYGEGFFLFAQRGDGEPIRYYLHVLSIRTDARDLPSWTSATDQDGISFSLMRKKTSGASELDYASVPREYLEKIATGTGMRWRVVGENAQEKFTIPPHLVAGFLKRCDREFPVPPAKAP